MYYRLANLMGYPRSSPSHIQSTRNIRPHHGRITSRCIGYPAKSGAGCPIVDLGKWSEFRLFSDVWTPIGKALDPHSVTWSIWISKGELFKSRVRLVEKPSKNVFEVIAARLNKHSPTGLRAGLCLTPDVTGLVEYACQLRALRPRASRDCKHAFQIAAAYR